MEFLRWILILTGVALLVTAYRMNNKNKRRKISRREKPAIFDPSIDELSMPAEDPLDDNFVTEPVANESEQKLGVMDPDFDGNLTDEQLDQVLADIDSGGVGAINANAEITDDFEEIDLALEEGSENRGADRITSFASAVKDANVMDSTIAKEEDHVSSYDEQRFAEEFETHHEPVRIEDFDEKLVSVNVVASNGRRFYGSDLKALFDKHGYTYGLMSLYHCSLDGSKVFSIANMVKPGTFDESQLRSFETPGITLFMRLPIELDSDVAFDFLIREAKELAEELDGQLRDGNRNPLSEQTIQHMREDMQQYVFRSKQAHMPASTPA